MFQLLLAPVHKVRYLLLGASQHLCGLPVAQFFKIDQKKCLPVFLFELAQCGVQLLVLFVLEQPGFGQCLVRQFKRQFLQRQKKPPPGLSWVFVKQFSRNDMATACQDWLRVPG